MYQAPIVAAIILGAYAWRSVSFALERKGMTIPMFMQHYTVLYGLVLVLSIMAINSLYTDVLKPSHWLDNSTVCNYVLDVMRHSDQDAPLLGTNKSAYITWQDEADLVDLQWLKYIALSTPFWCVATFVVCAVHAWDHVKVIQRPTLYCTKVNRESRAGKIGHENGGALWNDCVILILSLPMIYGLMAFKSVIRVLQIYINHIPAGGTDSSDVRFHSYEERKGFLLEMYKANFAVGDIMETVALVTFGELIADYLKKRMEVTKSHMKQKQVDDLDVATLEAATETVSALTVAGVALFCFACLLSGGWDLMVSTMPQDFPSVAPKLFSVALNITTGERIGSLQQEKTKASAEHFFLGFSFAASFAAIGNIMTLEGNYHHFLKEFEPTLKFWGTKILVSLACAQGVVFGALATVGWSTIQINLLYASTLSFECFLISIFHYKAWGVREEWFLDQHTVHARDSLKDPLLA